MQTMSESSITIRVHQLDNVAIVANDEGLTSHLNISPRGIDL